MNKILEEFKRIKTQRNQFINETNKKSEFLLSQAKNKFDSIHNTILDKNINKKNIEKEIEYLDLIKLHLSKAINLNQQISSYNSFFLLLLVIIAFFLLVFNFLFIFIK